MQYEFRVGASDIKLELKPTSQIEEKLFSDLLLGNGLEIVKEGALIVVRKKLKPSDNESSFTGPVDGNSNTSENSRSAYT